jgi:hypothetical protein
MVYCLCVSANAHIIDVDETEVAVSAREGVARLAKPSLAIGIANVALPQCEGQECEDRDCEF